MLASRTVRTGLIALVTSMLSGCLVIPTPEVSEIRRSRLAFIEPGTTTKRQLEFELLSEDVSVARVTEPYTIYSEYRRSPFSLIGQGSSELMGDVDDYLVVEYDDDDIVVRFDRIMREGGCTDFGVCVRGGNQERTEPLLVYGPTSLDEELQRFEVPGGTCGVYAYVDNGPFCNAAAVEVAARYRGMRGLRHTRARGDAYLYWDVPTSPDSPQVVKLIARQRGEYLAEYEFDCGDGEIQIVELELRSCTIGQAEAVFTPMVTSEGLQEILDRRLLLQ